MAQSFFDPLPAGADLYLLKGVLNDWPDQETLAILSRCGEAARPNGRVVILGGVKPDDAPRRLEIEKVLLGSKDNTLSEFRELAREASLEVVAAERQPSGRFVVECRPLPYGTEAGGEAMQIANISLSTQDLAANRRFYVDFLGIGVKGDDGKMLVLEGNLVIDSAHGNPTTTGAHIMVLADDLDPVSSRAVEFGYPCSKSPWGNLSMKDPDGRMVEVMSREKWSAIQRRADVNA